MLFDSGSQRKFISKKIAKKLKCEVIGTENVAVTTFVSNRWTKQIFDVVSLNLVTDSGEITEINALVSAIIAATLKVNFQNDWKGLEYLKHLKFADQIEDGKELELDVIVGNDYYGKLITGEVLKGPGPIAMNSKFGWLISGPGPIAMNLRRIPHV